MDKNFFDYSPLKVWCVFGNLVPRVSHLTAWGERGETLVGSGHVSPRIWEMTIKLVKGWGPSKNFVYT